MDSPRTQLANMKAVLRRFYEEIENLHIENRVLFDLLLERCPLSKAILDEMIQEAQRDPEKRAAAHQQFSEMWKSLDETATSAHYEDILLQLPDPEKPN